MGFQKIVWVGIIITLFLLPGASALGSWSIVPSLDQPDKISSTLTSISILSSIDAWAVGKAGNDLNPDGTVGTPLVEHFDGTQWTIVPVSLPPNSNVVELNDVEALSPANVWAVGSYGNTSSVYTKTLIEHWDGLQWSIIPSPDQPSGSYGSELNGITAVNGNPNDIWAVGTYYIPGYQVPIILHWDGSSWKSAKLPPNTINGGLSEIVALSPNNIWAVGNNQTNTVFTLHWNGTRWMIVNGPTLPAPTNFVHLDSISAVNTDDIWVSGFTYGSYLNPYFYSPFVGYWDGSQWNNVTPKFNSDQPFTPNPSPFTVGGIKAFNANDVWIFGNKFDPNLGSQANIQHWDGINWNTFPVQQPNGYGTIVDMDGVDGTLLGVGYYSNPYTYPLNLGQHTLVEKYDG